jgi:hypothetical protein
MIHRVPDNQIVTWSEQSPEGHYGAAMPAGMLRKMLRSASAPEVTDDEIEQIIWDRTRPEGEA